MFRTAVLLAVVLVAAPLRSAVAANTPSVTASVSGYYAIGDGYIPESEWEPIAVTRNDRPDHAEASGYGGRFFTTCSDPCRYLPAFTSASVRGFASADPGVLRIYGSDLAIARGGLNGPNVPGYENGNSVYTNISASASFTDYLTVVAPGLAAGAPVTVPMRYVVEMVGTPGLGYPYWAPHPISVYARFDLPGFGPQIFSSDSALSYFRATPLADGNTLYVIRSDEVAIAAHVGEVLPISASFGVYGSARINPLNPSTRYEEFGAFIDGHNTAGIWLGELPSGMVITSASGHDYRIDPTAAVVPEPASVALLLAGLGTLGLMARRRRPLAIID